MGWDSWNHKSTTTTAGKRTTRTLTPSGKWTSYIKYMTTAILVSSVGSATSLYFSATTAMHDLTFFCNITVKIDVKDRYPVMTKALNESGQHIFFSMCEQPATWARPVANSWRTTGGIRETFDRSVRILIVHQFTRITNKSYLALLSQQVLWLQTLRQQNRSGNILDQVVGTTWTCLRSAMEG